MIRKLTLMFLSGVICLTIGVSALAMKYNEAPMLKVMVAAGELPPVEERLPEEPLIIEPIEKIGKYGGILTNAEVKPDRLSMDIDGTIQEMMFIMSYPDYGTIRPGLATGWDISDGGKTVTVYLRKGIKWSDGAPFTADDILFWYKALLSNETLTPVKSFLWVVGGELMKMEKVDDYTFRMRFAKPYSGVIQVIAQTWGKQGNFYLPKHFMEKFHIDYNPKANELAKEEGYDSWNKLFHFYIVARHGAPTVSAYVTEKRTSEEYVFVRNPYYWKVDSEGNQLPYIDRIQEKYVSDLETINMMILSGELGIAANYCIPSNLPLYKKNEEKGGYRTLIWQAERSSAVALAFNETYTEDKSLRPLFRNPDFRKGMSLAINREEINELTCFGLAEPQQVTVTPSTSYYEERWAKVYAEYDPERANKLLDKAGLNKRGPDGFRLWNGKPLSLTIEFVPGGPKTEILELVTQYWREVGIKCDAKSYQKGFYDARTQAGKVAVSTWHTDFSSEASLWVISRAGLWFRFPHRLLTYGHAYMTWWDTGGKEGEEPPDYAKRVFEIWDRWVQTEYRSEEYKKLGKELMDIFADRLWIIGTVGYEPILVIVKKNLRNVVEKGKFGCDLYGMKAYLPEQWFFD